MRGQWKTLCPHTSGQFGVKGTELAQRLYGDQSRFAIIEVRSLDADRQWSTRYRVRDAATVSDAEVRAGARPKVVGEFSTYDECERFCESIA